MDRSTALDILRAHETELRERGGLRASLFGSTARGEERAGSDRDVMIDIGETAIRDVYSYVGVVGFIAELFPIAVDIATRSMLKPHVRPEAERDAIHAF